MMLWSHMVSVPTLAEGPYFIWRKNNFKKHSTEFRSSNECRAAASAEDTHGIDDQASCQQPRFLMLKAPSPGCFPSKKMDSFSKQFSTLLFRHYT